MTDEDGWRERESSIDDDDDDDYDDEILIHILFYSVNKNVQIWLFLHGKYINF